MKTKQIITIISLCLSTVACSNEELGTTPATGEHGALTMTASIDEELSTRADGSIQVVSGIYYFSYAKEDDNYKYITTEAEFTDSKGIPWKTTTEPREQLTWSDINRSSQYFVLDNMSALCPDGDYEMEVDLTNIAGSNYNAQKAPETDGGGNDILWGKIEVKKQNELDPLRFDLKHKMSKLTFRIRIAQDVWDKFDRDKPVKVELSNVITTTKSFARLKGVVTAGSEVGEPVELDGNYAQSNEADRLLYITDSWIFPPQEFVGVAKKEMPELKVSLPKKDAEGEYIVYNGVLPQSMKVNGAWELLSFKEGYHLTIAALLTDDTNMEINFQPVLVEKWTFIPQKDLNIMQVGIRTGKQLEELIEACNVDKPDEKILKKYGVKNEGKWEFDLWKDVTTASIEEDATTIGLGAKISFIFNSNNYTVNGKYVNSEGEFTEVKGEES